MKRARVGWLAAAVLAVASVAFAQAKPDFSGTWTLDPEASGMAAGASGAGAGGGRRGGMAGPMVVKQTADTLTVERGQGERKTVTTYKLDGTESVNKQTMGQNEIELKSVAKWDGAKLTIKTQRPGRDGAMTESTETWSLDDTNLTIERTGTRGGGKQVYKKTT
jgi:hypothetical protein